MAKEISEKTFELNITSEILSVGRYLEFLIYQEAGVHYYPNRNTVYCEGLTQYEEQNGSFAGTDVIIKHKHLDGTQPKILFIQFKSGIHRSYCRKENTIFSRNSITPEHILFEFNNDSSKKQHIDLRNIANRKGINKKSVVYAFPRITSKQIFHEFVGELALHTSFVPAVNLDSKAAKNGSKIEEGKAHKFRIDYNDESRSEVNYYYYYFGDDKTSYRFISDLVMIEIARAFIASKKLDLKRESLINAVTFYLRYLLKYIKFEVDVDLKDEDLISYLLKTEPEGNALHYFILTNLRPFLSFTLSNQIDPPEYKSEFCIDIPDAGLKFAKNDSEFLNRRLTYQIF